MARDDPQMKIRFPAELKAQIEDAARDNNRSMNAEIVHRLEQSLAVASNAEPSERTIYVVLDHQGLPTSWPEVMAQINLVVTAGGIEYDSLHAVALDANLQNSQRREDQWDRLRGDIKALLTTLGKAPRKSQK